MGKSIEKISSDVSSLNGAIRELNGRVDQILTDQSYGLTDSSLAEGVDLSVISLQENIRGTIEQGSVVILAYPDGSNPLLIENTYGNQPATGYEDDFIVKLSGVGTTISPTVDYPTGSIIYQANYSTVGGSTSPGGTGTGSFLSVQYNNNGSFDGDSSFQYSPTTGILAVTTLAATSIGGILAASTTVAASPPAADDSLKVATTEWVLDNAIEEPGGVLNSIQSKSSNGNFIGYSQFKFYIDQSGGNLYMNGRATFGDANNGATGIYAFAIGTNNNATSQDAFALGENALASGRQSIAGGYECLAQGAASFAIGALTSSYGERSASFGSNSDNYGEDSVVMGHNHGVATTSDRSLTLGYENTNNSSNSLLMGQSNTLLNLYAGGTSGGGTGCFVGGYNNSVQVNDSIVFGSDCDAGVTSAGGNNSKNQFLFGLGLGVPKNNAGDAAGQSQTVVGKYNSDQNQGHTLFAVGNGTSAARSNAFLVDDQGRVGIGYDLPTYTLDVVGGARKSIGGSTWATTSDERVKKNIRPYEKGLSEIIQIETKVFNYNGKGGTIDDSIDNVGVIAQQISKVFPNTVEAYNSKLDKNDDEGTEILSFNPNELTYALINSVKELNAEVQALRKELNELKNK
jgi:outer membrane murein-binding lipoprotein Lpp